MIDNKAKGWGLILFSILGIIGVLVYKSTKNSLIWIGPKTVASFVVFGILILKGGNILLANKKK